MEESLKNLLMGLTILHVRVNSLANDLAKIVEGIESDLRFSMEVARMGIDREE